jgi:hypothetical protein
MEQIKMTNQLYIANLGKYNEGELVGSWFTFPIDMQEVSEQIGLNAQYEEWAIHDYEFDFPLSIGEYESIEKLNELVEKIESNSELVELFEVMQTEKYDTDKIAQLAMNVFNDAGIDHDIIDDDQIEEMTKSRLESGGYVGVKCFLQDASNTNEYHILDGYENVDRLTVEYIENVLSDYMSELKREYGL